MQKTHKILIIAGITIAAIVIAVLLYFLFGKGVSVKLFSVEAKNGDITEKINLTGQVKASQGVDLAFESQGKITANYVKVGDKIYAGQPLLAIDDSVLQSQLKQAQAQLDILNIDTVESKIDAGLQALYANSLSAAQKSVTTAKDILLTISDIQFNHFTGQTQENNALHDAKTKAVYSLLGQPDAGLWTSQSIGQLNGGAFGLVQDAINNPTQDNIDAALSATQTAVQDVSDLVNSVPTDPVLTPTERASISLAKTNINLEIITTSANIQAIASQKVNNSATITTTNAQINAAQAAIDAIKTQISKTVIRALFAGQVDKDNAVVGQIVSPNVPVITISNNNLEIDTDIPEVDLSGAKVGGDADITLDAFGNSVIFPATIFSIDSAPSTVNGISAYGARLKFKNFDDRIKPGMTANITVISATHSNVLIIPKSAVIQNNNKYFVVVDKGNSQKETREVTVGLYDDKNIEVTSGLKLGEKVFAY
jgi:HlyD family secretion protein